MMNTVARVLLAGMLLSSPAMAFSEAQAEIYLVVNASSPIQTISRKEAIDLFTGRTRALRDGGAAQLFDLPRDSRQRASFYQSLTGKSLGQINSYWSRLMFSGQTMPPQALPSEQAMVESLRANANALGYLTSRPTDDGLRTVLVLKNEQP